MLVSALSTIGDVSVHGPSHDERGRLCVEAVIAIRALNTNAALGDVMEALHHAPGFDGAEISYTPVE